MSITNMKLLLAIFAVLIVLGAWLALRPEPAVAPVDQAEQTFFGFIRDLRMENGKIVLRIDDLEFLSGEEAKEKGSEDTGCPKERIEECIPSLNNGFYIRNLSTTTESFALGDNPAVSAMENPGSPVLSEMTPTEFEANWRNPEKLMGQLPFKFTALGNMILGIEQQYVP